jgi:hypothetical protein
MAAWTAAFTKLCDEKSLRGSLGVVGPLRYGGGNARSSRRRETSRPISLVPNIEPW